jgi:hypothetical protein
MKYVFFCKKQWSMCLQAKQQRYIFFRADIDTKGNLANLMLHILQYSNRFVHAKYFRKNLIGNPLF